MTWTGLFATQRPSGEAELTTSDDGLTHRHDAFDQRDISGKLKDMQIYFHTIAGNNRNQETHVDER
jgi:hypothetical protein